jgi:predicted transcriptional regulator
MPHYNPRTIRRDLALLTEDRLYAIDITIRAGGSRVSMVDVADFAPPSEVLDIWNSLHHKTKPPQIRLFEALELAVKALVEERRALYDRWTVQLGIERVVGGSQFPDFLNAYEAAKAKGAELLETVLAEHTSAKSQWLETEIRPLLAATLNRSDLHDRLAIYENWFPSYDRIARFFGMEFRYNPTRSYRELLGNQVETQQLLAKGAIPVPGGFANAEAEYVEATNRKRISEDEAIALQRAMTYQDQRIRSAIEEKVSEVRVQVLSVLQRQLQQVVDRGWISGRLPVGMQRDLESLAQSAQVLTQTDQSFADIATHLTQVNATGRDRTQPESELQNQVQHLLNQIQSHLTVPESEPSETLDRAAFVDFGWDLPTAA